MTKRFLPSNQFLQTHCNELIYFNSSRLHEISHSTLRSSDDSYKRIISFECLRGIYCAAAIIIMGVDYCGINSIGADVEMSWFQRDLILHLRTVLFSIQLTSNFLCIFKGLKRSPLYARRVSYWTSKLCLYLVHAVMLKVFAFAHVDHWSTTIRPSSFPAKGVWR